MTEAEFVRKYQDRLFGISADAATAGRTGAHMAMWLRGALRETEEIIKLMYRDLQPPIAPPVGPEASAATRGTNVQQTRPNVNGNPRAAQAAHDAK